MLSNCPLCQSPLTEQPNAKNLGELAETYADCKRICVPCGIGLSNAPDRPTFIRRDWRDGLWRRPTALRLARIASSALNEQSREKKLGRLANERSEDLLTWNLFSWLEDRGLLGNLVRLIGLPEPSDRVRIFYWGANDRYDLGFDLRGLLQSPDSFNERPASLSEPDVMLLGESALVLVEAKFGSPNDKQSGKVMDKYVNAAPGWFLANAEKAKDAGYYELTRNWAIGGVLSERLGKRFALVNLVREGQEGRIADDFGPLLSEKGLFKRLTWEDVVTSIEPTLAAHLSGETVYFEPAFPTLARPDDTRR